MHPFRFIYPFTVTRPIFQHFNISCRVLTHEDLLEYQKTKEKMLCTFELAKNLDGHSTAPVLITC